MSIDPERHRALQDRGRATQQRIVRIRQRRYLRELVRAGGVRSTARERANVPGVTIARWRRTDADYAQREADVEAGLLLELEDRALQRARLPYDEDRSSADLLKFLLKAGRPARYSERVQHDVSGEVHVKRLELGDASLVLDASYSVSGPVASDNVHYVALTEGSENDDDERKTEGSSEEGGSHGGTRGG